jgi:hypothetical protein
MGPLWAKDGMLWFKEMHLDVRLTKGGFVIVPLDCQIIGLRSA